MTMTTTTKKTRTTKRAIAAEDDSAERETAYLLKSPANAEHLRQSLAEHKAGKSRIVSLEDLRNL